jgi:hypothetical protein
MAFRLLSPVGLSEEADLMRYDALARGLGWFSIALGLAEVVAPRRLGSLIGTERQRRWLPALGLREIAAGVGLLADSRRGRWLWARVAGDAMDLGVLGAALKSTRRNRGRVIAAIAAVAGVTLVDALCARRLGGSRLVRRRLSGITDAIA